MHDTVIAELDAALALGASAAMAQSMQRFFPEPVSALGISNAAVASLAAAALARHRQLAPDQWLAIAEHFARTHQHHEHLMLASALVVKVARGLGDDGDLLARMALWLERDVGNWAQCDDLCIKPMYIYLKRRPQLLNGVCAWGGAAGPWRRRASNVALVKFVGQAGELDLALVLANCERLLADPDPYVQKGTGWLLKVAVQRAPQPVLAFLHRHRAQMARSTLRYAIEKLPQETRIALLQP